MRDCRDWRRRRANRLGRFRDVARFFLDMDSAGINRTSTAGLGVLRRSCAIALEHRLIRGQLQLAAHLLFVHAGALKRAGAITNRNHAGHEAGDRRSVERIRGNELLAPTAFRCEVVPLTRFIGKPKRARRCAGGRIVRASRRPRNRIPGRR